MEAMSYRFMFVSIRANDRYPIPTGGDLLNLITISFDHKSAKSKPPQINITKSELMALYRDWDPVVKDMVGLIDKPDSFPIFDWSPIKTWTFEDGRVVLLGDAAHVSLLCVKIILIKRLCCLITVREHPNPLKTVMLWLVVLRRTLRIDPTRLSNL